MVINFLLKPSRVFLLSVYFSLFLILFITSLDFIGVWILIEISGLVFLCIILRVASRARYTSNMIYFILQACFGINIIILFIAESFFFRVSRITTVFILTKVGAAPLNVLYFYSLNFLDTLLFFLALSTQKLFPVFLLITHFSSAHLVLLFIILSRIIIIFLGSNTNPIRRVLITRSLFNSSWLVITSMVGYPLVLIYFLIYSFFLFLILFKNLSLIPFITLIGLPPFPLFFVKLRVIYFLLLTSELISILSLTLFTLFLSSLAILSIYFNTITQIKHNS